MKWLVIVAYIIVPRADEIDQSPIRITVTEQASLQDCKEVLKFINLGPYGADGKAKATCIGVPQ